MFGSSSTGDEQVKGSGMNKGRAFWEAWCEGTYPADAFHDQAFARAQEFGELYVYRGKGGPSGNELRWEGQCGRCSTGAESHDAFLLMDEYLQHDCSAR